VTSEILSKEFEEIQNRDLSQYEIEYLFLDAIYETLRSRFGIKEFKNKMLVIIVCRIFVAKCQKKSGQR